MTIDINSVVHHKLYGEGKVIKITNKKIYVSFDGQQRIFIYPDAFEKGYLSSALVNNDMLSDKTNDETREVILDANNNLSYGSIYEAINATVGTNYSGWMKATWPSIDPDLPFRIWFVKLAELKNGELVAAANDCLNTISDDWNEVVYDDLKERPDSEKHDSFQGISLIYAKEPQGGPYIFRGAFINNKDKTTQFHHVSKRIGTRVKLIGSPSNAIELLDDFRNK